MFICPPSCNEYARHLTIKAMNFIDRELLKKRKKVIDIDLLFYSIFVYSPICFVFQLYDLVGYLQVESRDHIHELEVDFRTEGVFEIMNSKTIVAALFTFLAMLEGCAIVCDIMNKPEIKITGVTITELSLFQARPVFELEIANPNPVDITVSRITYDLEIEEELFTEGVIQKRATFPAGGTGVLKVPITISYHRMFETAGNFVLPKDINYRISGTADVGPFSIPYEYKDKFDTPKLPEISISKIELSKLSFSGASMIVSLALNNSNPFALKMDELDYLVNLAGTEIAVGKAKAIPSIEKKSVAVIKIPFNINFMNLGQSFRNILTGKACDYELSGKMKFFDPEGGEKHFSFHENGNAPLIFKRQ